MKSVYDPAWNASPAQKNYDRRQAADILRLRGTPKKPDEPRDVTAQAGPRGVLLTWKNPARGEDEIVGWRIYKDNENNLIEKITDRATKQKFVDAEAGSNPPSTNFFISAINAFGAESRKVQVIAQAQVEAGAPSLPTPPPGFDEEDAGGGDTDVIGRKFGGDRYYA